MAAQQQSKRPMKQATYLITEDLENADPSKIEARAAVIKMWIRDKKKHYTDRLVADCINSECWKALDTMLNLLEVEQGAGLTLKERLALYHLEASPD